MRRAEIGDSETCGSGIAVAVVILVAVMVVIMAMVAVMMVKMLMMMVMEWVYRLLVKVNSRYLQRGKTEN